MPHIDILDQKEGLRGPFIGSLVFHSCLALTIGSAAWTSGGDRLNLGNPNGGLQGSVVVKPVNIPLPNRGARTNPVADETQSQLPAPPPDKAPPKKAAPPPDAKAIPIPAKNAPRPLPSWYHPEKANKFREQQDFKPNQLYSNAGTALSNPDMRMPGGGGVGLSGTASPFGSQFGAYADVLIAKVSRAWNRPSGNITGIPRATISFTLRRDGTVSDVKVSQRSALPALDFSAQRAILDAAPFPAFPPGLNKTEVGIDFVFELSR